MIGIVQASKDFTDIVSFSSTPPITPIEYPRDPRGGTTQDIISFIFPSDPDEQFNLIGSGVTTGVTLSGEIIHYIDYINTSRSGGPGLINVGVSTKLAPLDSTVVRFSFQFNSSGRMSEGFDFISNVGIYVSNHVSRFNNTRTIWYIELHIPIYNMIIEYIINPVAGTNNYNLIATIYLLSSIGLVSNTNSTNSTNINNSNNTNIILIKNMLNLNYDNIRILLRSFTDYYGGRNLGQNVFIIEDIISHSKHMCTDTVIHNNNKFQTSYTRYYDLTSVVISLNKKKSCTLLDKVAAISVIYYSNESAINILSRLVLYANLRLFLGFLLYGKFNIKILLRKNTTIFFDDLCRSRYKNFIEAFQSDLLNGFDKYFKYSKVN